MFKKDNTYYSAFTNNQGKSGTFRNTCKDCGAKRKDSQLGLEETPEEYVENMVKI